METVQFSPEKEIPVVAEADVLVVGGGPGGVGAAVMSAREGASTVLAEQHGRMGGTATFGEITPMMINMSRTENSNMACRWISRCIRS